MMQKTSWDADEGLHLYRASHGLHLRHHHQGDGPFKTWEEVVAYRQGQSRQGHLRHAGRRHVAAHRHGADRGASGIQLTHVPFKGGAEIERRRARRPHDAAGRGNGVEAAGRGGPAAPADDLDGRAQPELARCADAASDLGYPFVFDSPFGIAGPKGMDPAVVKKLHDAFKTAIEDKAVIDMLAKYDMVPRYIDSAGYRKASRGGHGVRRRPRSSASVCRRRTRGAPPCRNVRHLKRITAASSLPSHSSAGGAARVALPRRSRRRPISPTSRSPSSCPGRRAPASTCGIAPWGRRRARSWASPSSSTTAPAPAVRPGPRRWRPTPSRTATPSRTSRSRSSASRSCRRRPTIR